MVTGFFASAFAGTSPPVVGTFPTPTKTYSNDGGL